jgi:hypothetical protein
MQQLQLPLDLKSRDNDPKRVPEADESGVQLKLPLQDPQDIQKQPTQPRSTCGSPSPTPASPDPCTSARMK